jgi:hypothetical protein
MTETQTEIHAYPNGWNLVTHGAWQISVGPDAVIQLPRHVHPDDVPHFIEAMKAAADLAGQMRDLNEKNAAGDDRSLPRGLMKVTPSGQTPAGYTKIPGTQKNKPVRGSIGRRGARAQPNRQVPSVPAPPRAPHRGQ